MQYQRQVSATRDRRYRRDIDHLPASHAIDGAGNAGTRALLKSADGFFGSRAEQSVQAIPYIRYTAAESVTDKEILNDTDCIAVAVVAPDRRTIHALE
jgi:hypothetical protein